MKTLVFSSVVPVRAKRWLVGGLLLLTLSFHSAVAAAPEGEPIVGADGNLLVNGNFQARGIDLRPLRWSLSTTKSTPTLDTIVSDTVRHGAEAADSSLKVMDDTASESIGLRSERRLATPGVTYEVTAWVKGDTGTPARLYLEFWNEAGARILPVSYVDSTFNTAWQQRTLSQAAPAGTLHVTVTVNSLVGSIGTSYWDDIVLKAVPPAYSTTVAKDMHELFLDDYRIEAISDVARVVQAPERSDPLIRKTKTWELDFLTLSGTVLKGPLVGGGTGYRMWYYSNGKTLYAESTDGLAWTKPVLNSYTFSGNSNNNIAFPLNAGRITLVYDDAAPLAERYKALVQDSPLGSGYYYYYSQTGVGGWTVGNGGAPVITYGDVCHIAYYQPTPGTPGTFVATTKQRTFQADTMASFGNDRMAFVSTSTDFITWTQPGGTDPFAAAVESDQADDFDARSRNFSEKQIYGMPVYPYGSCYIGFPWMLEVTDYTTGKFWEAGNGPVYPQLAISRDLRTWSRPSRQPIIALGTQGAWDDGAIYTASTLIKDEPAGKMYVYYSGLSLGHGSDIPSVASGLLGADDDIPAGLGNVGQIARASWRIDGFASLQNQGGDEGYVLTKEILVPAGTTKLRVNGNVQTGGSLKVEILNTSGTPITNFTYAQATTALNGDFVNGTATWSAGSSLTSLAGTTVKLKFYLKKGDLFSFWFE